MHSLSSEAVANFKSFRVKQLTTYHFHNILEGEKTKQRKSANVELGIAILPLASSNVIFLSLGSHLCC